MNDKTSWFGHRSSRNEKNQNRVFDPAGENSQCDGQQAINSNDERNGLVELYLRSLLLTDMGFLQEDPAPMQMAMAQQPTRQTRKPDRYKTIRDSTMV